MENDEFDQKEVERVAHVFASTVLRAAGSVLVIQRDLTHAAVWKPENVSVETIATPLQGYQSLLHVLLLAFARITQRQRTQAIACVTPVKKDAKN